MSVFLRLCLCLSLSIWLYICLSVYLSVCLSICLSICLSVCLSVCISVRLSTWLYICLSVCHGLFHPFFVRFFFLSRFLHLHLLPAATKLRQGNTFTRVCHSVYEGEGGTCLTTSWDTHPTHHILHTPLGRCTPQAGTPPGQVLPPGRYTTPRTGTHPGQVLPPPADGYSCGRYASYWNAFLFFLSFRRFTHPRSILHSISSR